MVIASITGLLGDKSSGQLGNIGDQAVDRVGASKDLVSGTNNQTKTNKNKKIIFGRNHVGCQHQVSS